MNKFWRSQKKFLKNLQIIDLSFQYAEKMFQVGNFVNEFLMNCVYPSIPNTNTVT